MSRRKAASPRATDPLPPIDLALQGGGSHGAFTWGVLDRLLQDETLHFAGISGTSAGALNAGVMATGWQRGGREGARAALRAFWLAVSARGSCFGSSAAAPVLGLAGFNLDMNPWYALFNQWLRAFAPQQFNPLDINPLRELVHEHVDEKAMRRSELPLFITATAVQTGQPRVFSGRKLSHDALLASACLPQLFRPVVVNGEACWGGSYSGNPALWPLIYETPASDVLLVRINPLVRPEVPDTAMEIADRVNEITFNAGLVSEMRAIHFVRKLLAEGRVDAGRYKHLRLHAIGDDAGMAALTPSSKLNTDRDFLLRLCALGQAAASRWLAQHRNDIGRRSTLDIESSFLKARHA